MFSKRKIEKYDEKVIIPDFLNLFQNGFKTERERELLVSFIKEHNKDKNTFYVLEIDNISVGMVSLKFDNISTNPTLDIDYLFVHKDYRKRNFKVLENNKISEFLLDFVIRIIVPQVKELVKFRYISLYPDKQSKKLIKYYLDLIPYSFELNYNKDTWIMLKI